MSDTAEATAAAGLSEFTTLVSPHPDHHILKRKRAITPSGIPGELEKQPLLLDEEPRIDGATEHKTFLYLAYGSNLAASTFEGTRRVKPLRAVNVHVPDLELTFDLSGIAYAEPCFANTRRRDGAGKGPGPPGEGQEYREKENLGWSKGLVGVVYEVTASDYKHIIETEGGGQGYADVQIPAYLLPAGAEQVPDPDSYPAGEVAETSIPEKDGSKKPFLVHTLLAPVPSGSSHSVRRPGWAQPSARYLGLLRTGSHEHKLPQEYVRWLESLQSYTITSTRQRIGKVTFMAIFGPLILALVKGGSLFSDKNGILPDWYGKLLKLVFAFTWWNYDTFFYRILGDGERTEGT